MDKFQLSPRSAVPVEQTWNKEALFENWDAWQKELEEAKKSIPVLSAYSGTLGNSPENLVNWFDTLQNLMRMINRLWVYVSMSTAVDTNDTVAKGALGQLGSFMGVVGAATAFEEPELQAVGDILYDWCEESNLKNYRHYINNILRKRSHTRSEEVEQILGMLEDPFGNISATASELTNSDLKFADAVDSKGNTHVVAQSTVTPVGIQSHDREHRRTAWQNFCDAHLEMKNTLASNFITHVKAEIFEARVRGYSSVLESRLFPTNLPVEVFYTLIDTFKANLPTWHRYWEIKRKALNVEKLYPYDIWAPLIGDQPVVDYPNAVDWISEGLAPLGEDYVIPMRKGCLEERWVDYSQNAGKRQGAFSTRALGCFPYIFTTFDGSLMAMSVLAHELGHSMHGYLSAKQIPPVYTSYGLLSSAVAETASNFNQVMTRTYLLKAKSDEKEFQLALIDEAMFNFHRYFFQMPNLARFELEVYTRAEQGQPLNADILNGIMKDIYAEGYGNTMTDDPERTSITWAQFGHLYAPFYTFQYSVGISAAHALADRVINTSGGPGNYLSFLRAGASLYPMDVFRLGGVDMSSPEPVEKTFAVLAGLIDRLEALTN